MSKKALIGTIIGCTIAIIAAIVLTRPPNGSNGTPGNEDHTPFYTLNIIESPSGVVSAFPPADQAYPQGTTLTLNATPLPGYRFDHWLINGQSSNLSAMITIPMDEDKDVVPVFVPESNSPVQIALDYFGVKDTHWISQTGGEPKARIQLVVLIRDAQGNLDAFTIPEEGVGGFYMDFFQVIALEDYMDPTIFAGTPAGSLTVSVAAYNINKGPITKAQIDFFSTWTGTDWSALKYFVQDQELVGSCWHTWSASDNFGGGSSYLLDDGNLKLWLRVGSAQPMPDTVPRPVLEPNVEIGGNLPSGVRVRQPTETFSFTVWAFDFTVENHESFGFPIYWRLETDSDPRTDCGTYGVSHTEGQLSVPGGASITQTWRYWFETPGNYTWTYIAQYPSGNPVDSWEGTLTVSP